MSSELWKTAEINSLKVLSGFKHVRVAESDLWGSTGYGLDDIGRNKLEELYSFYFGTESALVRPNISSGTHAAYLVALALNLRNKRVAFAPSEPYDSVFENIKPFLENWIVWNGEEQIKADVLWLQRSGGYRWFQGLNIEEISMYISKFKSMNPNAVVVTDNCYGEFVEDREPTHAGSDLAFGSLIKNPGGTVTPSGAYVVGQEELVHLVAEALFGPALAEEQGATGSFVRNAFQGFFLAPMLVHNSLVSKEKLMSNVVNALKERYPYSDVIVRTRWSFREKMIAAAQAVQSCGPINSYVSVEPFVMGGYNEPIVMAWTGFIQGESLSLSADGTVCEPYELFLQPGVNPFIIDNLCETLNLLN